MAQQVLGGIGAAVGFIYGGPTGAQYGWMIGSAIGGAIDPQVIQGPRIGDISQQTSQEGVPRPIVFALSPPITGNIIATGEPVIVRRKESQGKGGPKVETESVFRTYAIRVCEGPICGFVRVWRNGILVYDVRADSLLTTQENTLFLEKARFFLGSYEQQPSPDLESIFGVGTTPAHQGTAYMVMADEDLTDMRGAIPQYVFQVSTCLLSLTAIVTVANGGPAEAGRIATSEDAIVWENADSAPAGAWNDVAYAPELARFCAVGDDNQIMISDDAGDTWSLCNVPETDPRDWTSIIWLPGVGAGQGRFVAGQSFAAGIPPPAGRLIISDNGGLTWIRVGIELNVSFQVRQFAISPGGILLAAGSFGVGSLNNIIRSTNGGSTWAFGGAYPEGFGGAGVTWSTILGTFLASSTSVSSDKLWQSIDGNVWNELPTATTFELAGSKVYEFPEIGKLAHLRAARIYTSMDGDNWSHVTPSGSPVRDLAYDPNSGLLIAIMASGSSRIYTSPDAVTWTARTAPSVSGWQGIAVAEIQSFSYSLAAILTELSRRVGLDSSKIDVSDIDHQVLGFAVTNTYPCTGAMQALSQVFMFDPSNYDGVIHFVPRGADAALTITEDDMLVAEIEQSKRGDAISVPRVLHLNYHDVAGGLATDKQTSERSGDRRATGEVSLQTAVIMDADEAAQVLSINHKVMIEDQKGEVKFSLPDSLIEITVATILFVQWQGRTDRVRVVQCDIQDGYQEITAVRDRQSAYTSDVEGIPAAPQTPPPSGIVGPTLIQPLDIHILRDSDDSLSYYVAVSGILPAWQGALVELSIDGGENYIESQAWTAPAIMGETLTVLGDHPQAYPDEVNTVSVRIDTPLAELLETDLTGLLNRQNLAIIGDELIQFANADETSEGIWELSYLLRGRKGTTTQEHAIESRFVLLERNALAFVPANLTDLQRTLTFRATSFGSTSGTVVSMVYGGQSQTERAPAYLQVHRDGANVVISWQGVGRLGAGAQVAHGANFSGYRVTISDGSLTDTFDTTDEDLTEDVSSFSAPLTIGVQQRNNLTGLGPAIEVILQ